MLTLISSYVKVAFKYLQRLQIHTSQLQDLCVGRENNTLCFNRQLATDLEVLTDHQQLSNSRDQLALPQQ